MGSHCFGHQVRAPERHAAPTAVERVGAQHRVAHRDDPRRDGLAARHILSETVEQPRHHVHLLGDRLGPPVEPGRGGHQLPGARVEHDGIGQAATKLIVVGGRGDRDAEGAIVAHEHAVLHIAEITADGTTARRIVGIGQQAVEPREVHDAGVVDFFLHRCTASGVQPFAQRAASARGDHGEVGRQFGAVGQAHTDHLGHLAHAGITGSGDDTLDSHASTERHTPLGEYEATEHPLERGAATGQHHQVVVGRLAGEVGDRRRKVVAEPHFGGALTQQLGIHVGVVAPQQSHEPGEERMAVSNLGCTTAVPFERFVGRRRHRCVVALDHHDVVTVPSQHQRGPQARHSSTDHEYPHWVDPRRCQCAML